MWPFSQLNAFLDLGMIVHTADRVARLSIGQDVGNDARAALLAPLAALPVHLVLVGCVAQVAVLAAVQDSVAGRRANVVHILRRLGQADALHQRVLIGFCVRHCYHFKGRWKPRKTGRIS